MKQKQIWEVIKPFLAYYLFHNVMYLLVTYLWELIRERLSGEYAVYVEGNRATVTGVVSGLAMMLAVLPLIPMLLRELAAHKESVDQEKERPADPVFSVAVTVILAAASSVGLNILLTITGLVKASSSYQEVANRQYGVLFGAGMLLFGVIAPVAEEIVFRGLVFNRMRRYFSHAAAVIVSAGLFGLYHGNPVQMLYGCCMGILMAYLYERMHCFAIPCIFHATANVIVYVLAQSGAVQSVLFNGPCCVVLLAITGGGIWVVERGKQRV